MPVLPQPSAYSPTQLSHYSTFIALPAKYHFDVSPEPTLHLLNALHVHQISTIPYENLALHYTHVREPPSLDPQDLWEKIIGCNEGKGRGRGGYCVENTIFFKNILLGFGFSVYTSGARIRPRVGGVPGGSYMGWVHSVNIVTLPNGQRYMIDVSFGGDGATLPIPLEPGLEHINMGTQQIRLIYDYVPGQVLQHSLPETDPNDTRPIDMKEPNKCWIYQYRNSTTLSWNSFYAFPSAIEFLDSDLYVINEFAGGRSFQTGIVLIVKFLRARNRDVLPAVLEVVGNPAASVSTASTASAASAVNGVVPETEVKAAHTDKAEGTVNGEVVDNEEPRIYGKLMLSDGEVKLNDGTGKTKLIQTCRTEEERVEAVKKWFGIELTQEQREGIRGYKTELK